ncbi:MAG: nuclear transport factor 2 family protein [Planctomycetes bacterium]|nr:nuclear transport factor 2 family protein [Planctomycetota bacterium]
MRSEDVLAVVTALLDAWSRHDLETLLDLHSRAARYSDPFSTGEIAGRDALRQHFEGLLRRLPSLAWEARRIELYRDENGCMLLWSANADNGRRVDGISHLEFEDLLIVGCETACDPAALTGK